jgi:hypothetical protein
MKDEAERLPSQAVEVQRVKAHDADEANGREENNGGAIVLDTGRLKLPKGLVEEKEEKRLFGFDPIVFFILCLALAFIAVIAYTIWNGWTPPQ